MTTDYRSKAEIVYTAITKKALTVNEIADVTGFTRSYCRVMVGRWIRKDYVRHGTIRDGRITYTARGAGDYPTFVRDRGHVPDLILEKCKAKWMTAQGLATLLDKSEGTIRRHVAALYAKRKLTREIREGGAYFYRTR